MRRIPARLAGSAGPLALSSLFIALVVAILALWAWHERAEALADGERISGNLAKVLEEQSGRSFQAVDLTLAGIVDALRLSPPRGEHDPEFEQALRRKRDGLPHVRALFVIGPDGFITQDTDHPYTPRISLADRGYFKAHAADPGLELYVGPPLVSRSIGVWFVSVSRRIDDQEGGFGGVAVAAVEPRYFETLYRALALGKDDIIALFSKGGVLIARNPRTKDAVGQSFAHFDLFRKLTTSSRGTYRVVSTIDGVPRILSYRALDPYPLVVVVGLGEEALLAQWRQNVAGAAMLAALLALVVAVLAIVLVRQQRQRELARERLARVQTLEALGHLTGGIAHDFRNLLTAISAGATRIHRRSSDAEVHRTAEIITDAVVRGNQLIAQLLAFARRREFAARPEDANAMLLELENLIQHVVGSRGRVVLALAPALWPCLADRSQFDAAILNLVVNAKDAMPAGGEVRIATANLHADAEAGTELRPAGEFVRVTVSDSGEGMAPEVLEHALDPFFTTKGDAGTGLGLSQVYGFLRQIGGDVRIESRVGVGTSVHLFLPRALGDAAHPSEPADDPAEPSGGAGAHSLFGQAQRQQSSRSLTK